MLPQTKKIAVFCLIAFFVASSLLQSAAAYNSATYGFTITPPSGWTTKEHYEDLEVIFTDPNVLRTAAVVGIAVSQTSKSLNDYVEAAEAKAAGADGYQLISKDFTSINDLSCCQTLATFTSDDFDYKSQLTYFVENGYAYIIETVSLASEYDRYAVKFEGCIDSFQLSAAPNNPNPTASPTASTVYTPTASPSTPNQTEIPQTNSPNPQLLPLIVLVITAAVVTSLVLFFAVFKRKKQTPHDKNAISSEPTGGTPAITTSAGNKFCRYCGAQIEGDSVFCEKCGQQLKHQ